MAWTAPMIHALLLRAPVAKAEPNLRVAGANRPMRPPSPRGTSAEMTTGYKK
jgi:hypothetical protein